MLKGEVPDNWMDLVKQSEEQRDEAGNDLTKLWASEEFDFSHDDTSVDDDDEAGDAPNAFESTPQRSNISPVNELLMPTMPDLDELTLRRSRRDKKPPERYNPCTVTTSVMFTMICLVNIGTFVPPPACSSLWSKVVYQTQLVNTHFDGTLNYLNPMAYSSTLSDNETYTFKEMLQQPDKNEFILAMMKEIQDHENREHWSLFPRADIPDGHKTILAIWSFKRKRFPDGRVNKHKARLCAHGGMQQWGVDYWETYAPVVNWLCIKTLLILSVIYGYHSRSIDFVLAFPQATLKEMVFMEFPAGVEYPNGSRKQYVLKLNKNLYGLKSGAYNWFQMLSEGLQHEKLGFKSSEIDPCVFIRKDAIILTWVDDCIIFSKNLKTIEVIVESLKEDFDVELEEDIEKEMYQDI